MRRKITLLDGATGTLLLERAGGGRPVWSYNLTRPELVRDLHAQYVAAGAELVLTNTLCANRIAVRGTGHAVGEIVRAGVRLAREAASGAGAKVALDVGPLAARLAPWGDMPRGEAADVFAEQIAAGMEEEPDCVFLETFTDLEMLSIALGEAKKFGLPVFCSMSFAESGKTPALDAVGEIAARLEARGAFAMGLNCSFGPGAALRVIERFAECTALPLIFKPNAGMPPKEGEAGPEGFARLAVEAARAGACYVGGCCGTSPAYIARLREGLETLRSGA